MGIIFGCLGLMNAANTVVLPQILQLQKTFMHSVMSSMPTQPSGAPAGKDVAAAFDTLWGPMPGWFRVWCVVGGLLGLGLSGTYIYAAISLLQMKQHAVRLFCACSVAAIVLAFIRGGLGVFAVRFMGIGILMTSSMSIALHVVLLLVVITSEKSAFGTTEVLGATTGTPAA
jgi:hypothetical protein